MAGAASNRVSTAKALAALTAPEVNYEPPKDPAARKKGAVIGAPAVLNPEGLLAAAHVAQEKELLHKQQVPAFKNPESKCGQLYVGLEGQ